MSDLLEYPGGDLVLKGLRDLEAHLITQESLLVLIAGPRLRGFGFSVPKPASLELPYEHRLYELLQETSKTPYPEYNALIQRIVSFANAYVIKNKKGSAGRPLNEI